MKGVESFFGNGGGHNRLTCKGLLAAAFSCLSVFPACQGCGELALAGDATPDESPDRDFVQEDLIEDEEASWDISEDPHHDDPTGDHADDEEDWDPSVITWARTYNCGLSGRAHAVDQTADGGYIVAGEMVIPSSLYPDAWIVKLNAQGDIQWQVALGGDRDDMAYDVVEMDGGGFMVAGMREDDGPPAGTYGWLIRLDEGGDVLWQKKYGASGVFGLNAVQKTADGGLIAAGWHRDPSDPWSDKCWLAKFTRDGAIEWQREFWELTNATDILVLPEGGYMVTGSVVLWELFVKLVVAKLDDFGEILWSMAYGGEGLEIGFDIEKIRGGFLVAGRTSSFQASLWGGLWILKLDDIGQIVWQKRFSGTGYAITVRETPQGDYLLLGSCIDRNHDFCFFKFDADGRVLWERVYGGEWEETAFAGEICADGGFVAAGMAQSFVVQGEFWVLKTDGEGEIHPACPPDLVGSLVSEGFDTDADTVDADVQSEDSHAAEFDTFDEPIAVDPVTQRQCGR